MADRDIIVDPKTGLVKGEVRPDPVPAELAERMEVGSFSLADHTPEQIEAAFDMYYERRKVFLDKIRERLVLGVDYNHFCGKTSKKWKEHGDPCVRTHDRNAACESSPPGKDSLSKAGAEKICAIPVFNWTPLWDFDRTTAEMTGIKETIFFICRMIDRDGKIIAEGRGAPPVGKDANRAVKMAKKSALIDATITAAGLSELFTQDLDTMGGLPENRKPTRAVALERLREVESRWDLDERDSAKKAREMFGVEGVDDLAPSQVLELVDVLHDEQMGIQGDKAFGVSDKEEPADEPSEIDDLAKTKIFVPPKYKGKTFGDLDDEELKGFAWWVDEKYDPEKAKEKRFVKDNRLWKKKALEYAGLRGVEWKD